MRSDERENVGEAGWQRLSEMNDWEVSDGYPDVRGWEVVDARGQRIGRVDDLLVDTSAERVRAIAVHREGAVGDVRFAIEPARLDEDGRRVVVSGPGSGIGRGADAELGTDAEARIVRHEEELTVDRRMREAGEVAIRKRVETEHVRAAVPTTREEVRVERRPVTGERSAAPAIESDEIRVPVVEEEVVVEKRPVVKEELVVKVKPVTEEKVVEADVRKERVGVDRPAQDTRADRTERR